MLSQSRSIVATLIVMPLVTIAFSPSAEAQVFRRFQEGSPKTPESKQPVAKNDNRSAPETRSATQRNSSAGRATPAGRTVDPKQIGKPQPPSAGATPGGTRGGYPTALNGRPTNQSTPPSPRPQPGSNARSTQVPGQPFTQPQAGLAVPKQPVNRPSQVANPSGKFAPTPGLANPNLKDPVSAYFGSQHGPAARFNEGPLMQPQRSSDDKLNPSSADSSLSQNPAARSSPQTSAIEAGDSVDVRAVLDKFGLNLAEESEAVLVTQINAQGNAAQAGLQCGDKIISLGGAAVVNPQEFSQIAGLLSEGDQIELTYSRAGKEEKALVQYGRSTDPTAAQGKQSEQLSLGSSNWEATPQDELKRLQQLVAQQQQVIAELQSKVRELEGDRGTSRF